MKSRHHPDCACSQDVAKTADEDLPGHRPPTCTCKWLKKPKPRKRYTGHGRAGKVNLADGVTSIGNGNYWRGPLHGSD